MSSLQKFTHTLLSRFRGKSHWNLLREKSDKVFASRHNISMAPYLRTDGSGDEYGDVDDDDLLLAESNSPRFNSLNVKRKQPEDLLNNSAPKKACLSGDPKALTLAKGILKKTWGFADFRLKQQSAITRLIQGDSAVVIFPTGGGKSLVYQVPALAFNDYDKLSGRKAGGGVTLVVSPLIALMKVCCTLSPRCFMRLCQGYETSTFYHNPPISLLFYTTPD